MFLKERTEAIVLAREDHGEADRRVVLLTNRLGKIKATARGEKKLLSKLRVGLHLFSWSEIELVSGKSLPIVTAARPKALFDNLSKDWQKFSIAQKMMRDVEALMPWEMPDENTWLLSLGGLHALNQIAGRYQRLYYYFLWTLLSSWGYQVDLENCIRCEHQLPARGCYLVAQDGIICSSCLREEDCLEEISLNTIKILRLIAQKDKNLLGRVRTEASDRENLEKISAFFRESICQRQPLSKEGFSF